MGERTIHVSRTIAADVETVWDALSDIDAHVEWMADAERIRFTSAQTAGVGTTFDCATKVGPFRLTDRMEVTEWEDERSMAVRHVGIVTGEGRFTLTASPEHADRTELTWEETLDFPWWIPSLPAAVVLKQLWRGNLRRFERTLGPTTATATRGARRPGRRRHRAG